MFEKQVSPWSYLLSALALVAVMLCCMFPLAPHPVKLGAVYISMTLIILILCTLLVRSLLALSTWIILGRSLWLFPHLLSDVSNRPASLYCRPKRFLWNCIGYGVCVRQELIVHLCQ